MCLIVYSSNGFENLNKELQAEIYSMNPDGFGFFFYDEEEGLVAEKGLFSEHLIEQLIADLPNDRPVFLHWRMATSGRVNDDLAHPYLINNELVMMHNGVLRDYTPTTIHMGAGSGTQGATVEKPETNDTINFIIEYLKPAVTENNRIWLDKKFRQTTEQLIGDSNTIVMMDSQGHYSIYNYDHWVSYNGMAFSNEYAWPYDELVLGRSPIGTVVGGSGGAPHRTSEESNMALPLYINDLKENDWEDIFQICLDDPESVADILYYDIMKNPME